MKIYQNTLVNWVWDSRTVDNNPHDIYIDIPAAGSYDIMIGGRSKLFALDRFVLYRSGNPGNNVLESFATDLTRPESARGSCGSAKVVDGPGQIMNGQNQGQQSNASDGNALKIPEGDVNIFDIKVYPNPTTGVVNLGISPRDSEASIEVYDATGKLIFEQHQNGEDNVIDLSPYANGVYWIKVHSDGVMKIERVYKQ